MAAAHFSLPPGRSARGFTLIELVVVVVILGILAAAALPRFIDLGLDARKAAVQSLAGSVTGAMNLVHAKALVISNLGGAVGTVSLTPEAPIRVWNGWPDRWWDGVGISLQGASPASGGYLSTAPFTYNRYTFYGYGNGVLPAGLAGWVVTDAPTPGRCSVTYANDGSGNVPLVATYTDGC